MFLHFWYVFRTTEIILIFKNYPFSIIVFVSWVLHTVINKEAINIYVAIIL